MAERKRRKTSKKKYISAVGRRKTATARVRLFKGKGKILVNNQPIGKYFPGEIAKVFYLRPFEATETVDKYYATIKVIGSGKNRQLEAVVHGLARALDKENKELYHLSLKKQKLLTRDYRMRERRKPGQMGRARKKKQSPKR
jgi:small subunit ribosomal protein S9